MFEHLRSSLRYRLLAYTIPVVLLFVGLVYLGAFHFVVADAVTELARNFAEEEARFHKEKVGNAILREVSLIKLLSASPNLVAWVMHENDARLKHQAMNILEHSRTAFRDGNYFFVIDKSGHYYFNNKDNTYANKQLRYTLTPDMPEAAWYYATKKNARSCQVNVNNTEGLKTSKVWINCLMRHDGNVIGMIGTGMALTSFTHTQVRTDQPGVTNMYINRQGAIQIAPDVENIDFSSVTHDVPLGKTIFNLFDRSRDRTVFADILGRMQHISHGVETMTATIQGIPRVIGIVGIPEIGWFNVTVLDLNQLHLQRYFLPFALLIGVGVALLLVLLLWFLNRMVLSRIHRLNKNIRQMEAGDDAIGSSDMIPDEIGRLSGSFFDMVATVRDYTARLEEKVAERKQAEEKARRLLGENRYLTQQLLQSHEEERRRLARDLHDEAGQTLTAIQSRMVLIKNRSRGHGIMQQADETIALVNGMFDLIHSMLEKLNPTAIDDIGLPAALKNLVESWRRSCAVDCALHIEDGVSDLSYEVSVAIYRIVQEGLTNVARHARAKHVTISLQPADSPERREQVELVIRDDGCGMDSGAPKRFGVGLIGMRERVAALGGQFAIESSPESGTLISVTLPESGGVNDD